MKPSREGKRTEAKKMVKVQGPLHSDNARGKIAESVVFTGRRGTKIVRAFKIPKNTKTIKRNETTWIWRMGAREYQKLTSADRIAWTERAKGQPMSGQNLFLQMGLAWYWSGLWQVLMIRGLTYTPTATTVWVNFTYPDLGDVWLKAGERKGIWTHTKKVTAGPGGAMGTITGLTPETKYYLSADTDNPNFPGTYGYAKFETL